MANEGFTGTRADIIEHLTREHREVEQLWSQLQVVHGKGNQVEAELGQRIVKKLSQHDATELQVLYPGIRDHVPNGDKLADHALEEHSEVRDLLTQVDEKDPADESVFATFTKILESVQHHVEEEEASLFPKLREHCSAEELHKMGEMLEKAESMAPTHPHPHTPDSQLGATVAGAAAGAMDKARDAL